MKKTIALISEHASPLASLGGVDSGGQNVYVAEVARHLIQRGYQVDIFTRWDNKALPQIITWMPDVRVIHVKAGPIDILEKEYLFDHMPESQGTSCRSSRMNRWITNLFTLISGCRRWLPRT